MSLLSVPPNLQVKQELIQLAATEAVAHGVTASAVLRAIVDHELRPGFEDTLSLYIRTRSINEDHVLGLVNELLAGPIGLLEVLTLGAGYLNHDLTVDRATELLTWTRRLRQSAGRADRKLRQALTVADELAAAEKEATREATADAS